MATTYNEQLRAQMTYQNPQTDVSTYDVLETIRLLWEKDSTWPTWGHVDFLLDTRFGIEAPWTIVRSIDRSLLWAVSDKEPRDHDPIGLTVAGLAQLPNAAEDVRIFVDSVRVAAELVRTHAPSEEGNQLRSVDLPSLITLPAAGRQPILKRQHSIWRTTNLWTSLSGPHAETSDWTITIDRNTIRRCRGVSSVEDYLHAAASPTEDAGPPTVTRAEPPAQGLAAIDAGSYADEPGPGGTLARASVALGAKAASEVVAEPVGPRAEFVTTSNGRTFTLFPDHLIAQTAGSQVFAGLDETAQPVAIKRVPLRTFGTEPWYRDARAVEREGIAGDTLAEIDGPHFLPLLGQALDVSTFTFVYPLADTSLEDVVAVVAASRGLSARRTALAPGAGRSPVRHDPAQAALDLFGAGGPDEEQVRAIGVELAHGLALLHARQIVHRDIKPANILRLAGGWCIADLGIARLLEEATSTYTLAGVGTPEYMPPEISANRPASKRSDVYALGCTLYALLHGRPPWTGEDLARSHRLEAPDLSGINNRSLAVTLTAMLHKDEAARPSAKEVTDRLSNRPAAALDALGAIVLAAATKNATRAIDRARSADRASAAEIAIERFKLVWRELEANARSYPDVGFTDGQGAWLMTIGDWRLSVQIHEPASSRCPAVQLGTVSFEVIDQPDLRTAVANLVALWADGDDAPRWRIYRLAGNQISATRVPVSVSRVDGNGAVSLQHLADYLEERTSPGAHGVMVIHDDGLTADALLKFFTDEVDALSREEDTSV